MYDQLARYYDLTHHSLTEDIPFILSLAARTGGPVLELGCGTGRLLLPLAHAGFVTTGVDNSAGMLALAQEKLAAQPKEVRQRVTTIVGDMTHLPEMDGRFPLVIIPYNTFLHLDSAQKLKALQEIRKVMTIDGRLFIDLTNPFIMAETPDDENLILENSFIDPQTGENIQQFAANRLDAAAQKLHINWVYDVTGGQRTAVFFDYYYLFPHQWELLLANSDFRLEAIKGEYDDAVFSEESNRLLLTAVPR